jgi:hypothetical protein
MSNRRRDQSASSVPALEATINKSEYPDGNPKSAVARSKPGFHAIPASSLLALGAAMEDGRRKYGLTNWRANNVAASVYYNALLRHVFSWWDSREQVASDSEVHHLGHVMACCAIILDAEASGNLIDDRPGISGPFTKVAQSMVDQKSAR